MNAGARLSGLTARTVVRLRPAIAFARPDLGRQIAERVGVANDLLGWAGDREPGPLLWVHGASAGELMSVVPALNALAERWSFARLVTHFSPSGRDAVPWLDADRVSVPPLDTAGSLTPLLGALEPSAIVFAKGDVWPGMVAAAAASGVPTALVNGVVRRGSRRLAWPARSVFRDTYELLSAAGAASEEDAERLRRLGVRAETLRITGDTSFDQALARARSAVAPGGSRERFEARLPRRPDVGRRLIAGSTRESDEGALLGALESLPATAGGRFGWQLVVVPHQPGETQVRRLLGECRRRTHPVARWSDEGALRELPPHGIVVFDEMGSLAELYAAGDVAYVGGGFDGDGLHNVLEPAAAGVPVLIGERHDRRDATELTNAGGAIECTPETLPSALVSLSDPEVGEAAGRAASRYVRAHAGAAEATADLLEPLLRPGRAADS